jgi:hypothetical protein
MQKFEYVFNSLPYNTDNVSRVTQVLEGCVSANNSIQQHASGCVHLVVYLPSLMDFLKLEAAFRSAGLRK